MPITTLRPAARPFAAAVAVAVEAITGTAATPAGPTNENRGTACHWRPARDAASKV